MLFQNRPTPPFCAPQVRNGSPAPGCSTLITSAPNSPSTVATMGPAASVAASTTRRPRNGRSGGSATRGGSGALEPKVLAQRRAGVVVTEEAALLQLGHDEADHVLVGARGMRGGDDG